MKKILSTIIAIILSMQLSAFAQNYGIYDIHQHYVPDCYKLALLSHNTKRVESDGLPTPVWNVEEQLKTMDDLGIKVAFISLATPHPYWGDKDETIKLVRQINDEGVKIVSKNPDRFKLFATLPLPDVEASIEEIIYAYDKLHAVGIKLPTNTRRYLYW